MAGGNMIRFGAWLDDQVSGKLRTIRTAFDGVSNSKGFQAVAGGIGLGVGLAAWQALTAGIGKVVDVLQASVSAAMEEEAGISRLNAAIRANDEAWRGNLDSVEAAIKAGEAKAFSDDQVRDSIARLIVNTQDLGKATALTSTAQDLARLRNLDLATASDLVGKVYGGNIGILARYGIQLKKGSSATEALAAIQQRAAGQAEAYGRTTQGSLDRFNIAVENLQEEIGKDLLPILTEFANVLTEEVVPALAEAWQGLKDLSAFMNDPGGDWKGVDRLEAVAEFLGTSIDTSNFETAVEDVSAAVAQGAAEWDTASERYATNAAAMAVALADGAEGVEGGLEDIAASMKEYKDRIVSDARDLVSKLKATFTLRADWDVVVADFTDLLDRLAAAIEDPKEQAKYRKWADGLVAELKGPMTGERRVEILRDALNLTGDMGTVLKDGFAAQDPLIREGTKAMLAGVPELLRSLERDARTYGENTGMAWAAGLSSSRSIEAARRSARDLVGAVDRIFAASSPPGPESPLHEIDKWGAATGEAWADGLAAAIVASAPTVETAVASMADIVRDAPRIEADTGAILSEQTAGQRTVWDAVTDSAERAREAVHLLARASVDGFIAMADALALGRVSVVAGFGAVFVAVEHVGEGLAAMFRSAIAQARNFATVLEGDVVSAVAAASNAVAELAREIAAAGAALADLSVGGAAPAASGPYAGAIASLDKYIANLEAVAKPSAAQEQKLADYIARRAEYAARASGGPVLPEGTYLVGERGPEYLHMGNQSGWVEPGAGGQPVVIQVQVDGRTLAEVVDKRLFFKYRLGAT